ncbi:hypothetical protein ACFQVA_32750 [Actinomadura keratinilytica]
MEFAPEAGAAGGHAGQAYHVGRARISGEPTEPPLVVDWRAPVCRAFYQAGPGDPLGLAVRRRFGWAAGSLGDSADLTALEDERLDAGQAAAAGSSRRRSSAPGPAPCATSPPPSSPGRTP